MSEQIKPYVFAEQEERDNQSWKRFSEKLSDVASGAIIPVVVLVIWQLIGQLNYISPMFLPTPLSILNTFWELILSNKLTTHLGVSIGRAFVGFVIGGGLGCLFGIMVGLSKYAEYMLNPSLQLLRMTPNLAIAPLIILWFGFGEASKVVIIATAAFFPLYLNTFLGIRSVDNKLFEVAKVLEFSKVKMITALILPSALPSILLGVRLSLAISWLSLVVAELLGSQAGVGFLINLGKQNSVTEYIFVGIIIFAIFGKVVDSLVRVLEKRMLNWRDSYKG